VRNVSSVARTYATSLPRDGVPSSDSWQFPWRLSATDLHQGHLGGVHYCLATYRIRALQHRSTSLRRTRCTFDSVPCTRWRSGCGIVESNAVRAGHSQPVQEAGRHITNAWRYYLGMCVGIEHALGTWLSIVQSPQSLTTTKSHRANREGASGWLSHAQGISALVHARGAKNYSSDFGRELVSGSRLISVGSSRVLVLHRS
jgi:hypothetical protein